MNKLEENYGNIIPIGVGGFSKVFRATHKKTGVNVAIKMIPKKINNDDSDYEEKIQKEIEIMKIVKHPFIVELFEIVETEDEYFLIMDYASQGSILNNINERGAFSEDEASIIFAQIILVIKHLQQTCHIAHRDIKAENVLLDENRNIRVIDFGLSCLNLNGEMMKTQCGSPPYASPELILGWQYTFASDIWSCGILLYIMVCKSMSFYDENLSSLANKILFAEVEYPESLSPCLVDLLQKMLTKNPQNRISLDEILAHPWLASNVKYVSDKIEEFKPSFSYISQKLKDIGYDYDTIAGNMSDGLVNQGTVSFNILEKEFYNKNFPNLCRIPIVKGNRYASYSHYENLPPLNTPLGLKKLITPVGIIRNRKRSCHRVSRLI
ncbi:CAMK family protein kinase [Trichomonas vaginalis G3]|uniref:non-specific serine/threonine protein kinase n=1 Tax=Trichomonas vaginalis (strain ATCC PRA-98 / G3) TaxID=412133 RepID=A2EWC2_TRIV3|nr:protein serine/threonine kinase protein [Trichomonas vaginalis G3]EAY03026.1 CAMK family protein kinase [Trichomonas vaginalis G3]KAI5531449.1 protein serine/threonine kinase protein [Trichomonas vaginalis G3]|eukprot:XP_001315249.1 CAMK family protein kinase [Trichomonas vaginalis G3]